MVNTTGLTGAAPIWHDFMESVFADPGLDQSIRGSTGALAFDRPAGLLDVPICELSDLKATQTGPCAMTGHDLFIDPTRPITIGLPPPQALATVTTFLATPAVTSTLAASAVAAGVTATPTVSISAPLDDAWMLAQVIPFAPGQYCAAGERGVAMSVLRLPTDPTERAAAIAWSAQNGLPVEPSPCTAAMLASAGAANAITIQAQIASPASGSTVHGPIDISGSAVFSQRGAQFYKVEFRSGTGPHTWVTMGSVHPTPVVDGWLETWDADALPNGPYSLRVVVVKHDGNYITSPSVTVNVAH
jgi:hypothetical protein